VADYRLREYVAACLRDEASGCTSENCRRNAAFQLAFCYMTGFGLRRDEGAAFRWIEQSGKTINDMMATIEMAAVAYEPYRNQHVVKLISEGYLHQIDHANEYRNLGLLEDSERYYKREIHDMEIGLQNDNVVTRLKLTLADILDSQGKYDEAEMLLKPLVARTETDEWFRKIYTGDLDGPKTRLATVYVNQGLYEKAMELYQSALKSIEERVGKHHPQMLSANINFASLLQQLGQYQAAETIVRKCLRENKGTLGPNHPGTLTALQNLATLLYDQKHYEQAVEVMQDVIRLDEKLFGPDHHSSLISMNNLAGMNIKLKYYEAAEEMSRVVWERMTMILGSNHPHTITSLSTYGSALFLQHKDDAAEAVFRQSLDGMKKARGKNHHDVLISMNNLATLLLQRHKLVEARQIVEPVLDAREPIVVGDIEILRNFFRVGSGFGRQRMHDIAERLVRLAIEGEELALGKNDTETLASISTLVSLLLEQDNFTEAETVSRDALKRCGDAPDYQLISLALMNGLAVALEVQGKLDEAAIIHSQSLEGNEKLWGPDHPSTLTSLNNLAVVLSSQGKYVAAEEMHRRAMEGYVKILGSEHHDTLTTANNLASVIAKQDRLDEAAALYKKTLDGFEKVCDHNYNCGQETKHNLEIVLEKIQRKSQSTILGDPYQR
jgi:tetratricopeptide (TPR) repeat protein